MFLLKSTLDTLGIQTAASAYMDASVRQWEQMYKKSNGLRLPAAIASEIARLVTLEMKCEITGSERADFLNRQYANFCGRLRNITEYACASGGVILKPYVCGEKIEVSYIKAGNFIPTQYDASGRLTGAAFLDRRYIGGKIYTRVEHHISGNGVYTIKNYAFVSENESDIGKRIALSAVDEWRDIKPVTTISGLEKPLFAYFKMPMANTVDEGSPLGVSVYARAENLINDADEQYKRLLWEFKSGERAVMADAAAFRINENGERELPDERLFVAIDQENLFKEWTPTLREQNIIRGLNEILRKIEFNTGLAYGTLSDVQTVDKTAEEIKASKQRSYSQISDIQASLDTAVHDLTEAMDKLCDLYSLAPSGKYEISSEFDDSIIADRKAEFAEKQQLVSAGIMSKAEFRMWYFGETEEAASLKLEGICGASCENEEKKSEPTLK